MRRAFTAFAVIGTALASVAATPTQSARIDAQDAKIRPSLSLMAKATPLMETQIPSSEPLTCQQKCDVNFVRTRQICFAATAGLKTEGAPGTQDCNRAAKSGIQQCQATCSLETAAREKTTPIED